MDFTKGQTVTGDESGVLGFHEAVSAISDSLKRGRHAEGAAMQHTTKPRNNAYTMLKAKLRKLLLKKSVPEC